MPSRRILPTSGRVIGALAADLDLNLSREAQRSAREYFAGRRPFIEDATRLNTLKAVAVATVERGYVPELGSLPAPFNGLSSSDAVFRALELWAACCDDLVGRLHSEELDHEGLGAARSAVLRLVIVDLALRAAAVIRLSHGRPPESERTAEVRALGIPPPRWVFPDRRNAPAREVREAHGGTLDDLAAELGYSESLIDSWVRAKDPARPSASALDDLATILARRVPGPPRSADDLRLRFRWEYALAAIADRLAEIVGRPVVVNLAWALVRYVARAVEYVGKSRLADETFREAMLLMMSLGVGAPGTPAVLDALASTEADVAWKRVILAAGGDWLPAILGTIGNEASKRRAVGTLTAEGLDPAWASVIAECATAPALDRAAQVEPRSLATSSGKADALVKLAVEARARSDLAAAVVYLQGAVELDPSRAELHQDLGAHLGKIGRFDKGLAACRAALELRPGWSIPQAQIGIILLDAGRDAEALAHLEGLDKLEWTPLYGYILGLALMRSGQFEAAIEAFAPVLQEEPDHALALDCSAHCHLVLGRRRQGRRLARRAHELGQHETYEAEQRGMYRPRRR